jgi:SPP1 family predicted phage head-tail adaptor
MVAAGRYRHFVTIQSQVISKNTYGEKEITWADDITDYPAEIISLRGKEYYNARQIQAIVTHKITIRYITLSDGTRIKPSNCRIIFDDRIFNIESVININERNIDLEIMAIEEL